MRGSSLRPNKQPLGGSAAKWLFVDGLSAAYRQRFYQFQNIGDAAPPWPNAALHRQCLDMRYGGAGLWVRWGAAPNPAKGRCPLWTP